MIHSTDISGDGVLDDLDLGKLGRKLRFRVSQEVGFTCPDVDDLVQETLRRYLIASQEDKLRTPEAAAAFVNGICRNVISEYRRRLYRDGPLPEIVPEPPARGIPDGERFELRQAIDQAIQQLAPRDRLVLTAFYLEERSTDEILQLTGLTVENFRVVLCRAKERFGEIYRRSVQYRSASSH